MTNDYEIRGDTAVIYLPRRDARTLKTIIDITDLEKAKSVSGKWYPVFTNFTYYVVTVVMDGNKKSTVPLHRHLFDEIADGMVVDHINHDTLDNRRSKNLRVVSNGDNVRNRKSRKERRVNGNVG